VVAQGQCRSTRRGAARPPPPSRERSPLRRTGEGRCRGLVIRRAALTCSVRCYWRALCRNVCPQILATSSTQLGASCSLSERGADSCTCVRWPTVHACCEAHQGIGKKGSRRFSPQWLQPSQASVRAVFPRELGSIMRIRLQTELDCKAVSQSNS